MIPDEHTCRYFITITQESNISRAARRLYISQPSLSRFLSNLEKELGTQLFMREGNVLKLTLPGECFLQYILEVQKLELRYLQEINKASSPPVRVLRVGAGTVTSPYLTRRIFPALHQEYPDVELLLTEDLHSSLLQKLNRRDLDLTLLAASGNDELPAASCTVIAQSPRLFVISRSHPLAVLIREPDKNSPYSPQLLEPEMLNNQHLISGVFGQKVHEDLTQFIKKYNLNLPQPLPLQNVNAGIALAQCGMAIGIFPAFYIEHYPSDKKDLFYFYLDDPLMQWKMTVRYSNPMLRPIEKRFIELAEGVFSIGGTAPAAEESECQ